MRFFTARRLTLAALIPALFVLSFIPGCSNESEGERCGDPGGAVNTSDCDDGLVCVTIQSVNRCCYPDHVSDSRCAITTGINATSGSAGSAGTAGTAGSAGSSTAGASQAGDGATDSAGAAGAP